MKKIQAKTIITKSQLPEVDFCFNPYIGCTHACVYCYARFMGRFTGHAGEKWGAYLDCKVNAPDLLAKEAPKIKKRGGRVIIGSVTDCYQPVERKLGLTRQCLEVFLKHQIPISILTKNKLVERDLDLLKQFESCELGVSLSILDQSVQRVLERGASTPQERIEVLRKAKKQGMQTYLFLGPIHPFLTEAREIMRQALPHCDFAMGEMPNLKCGNWADFSRALKVLGVIPEDYKARALSDSFFEETKALVQSMCKEHSVELRGIFRH